MFCKHCGAGTQPGAAVCTNCGVALGAGNNYCQNCGKPTDPMAVVCTQCGASLNIQPVYQQPHPNAKSKMAAGLLAIFLGTFGVHNFYLGYTGKAVAQLLISWLTCGIGAVPIMIWTIIEGIQILTGSINVDAQGIPLKD